MEWIVTCRICGKEFDSQDSYADSKQMRRNHMIKEHEVEE